MLKIKQTGQFKKDLEKAIKSGWKLEKLKVVIDILVSERKPDEKQRDHKLSGNWKGFRDCHIEPDWVLIYKLEDKYLVLSRTGTHSELFK